MTEPTTTAQAQLREQILDVGLDDWVSLAEVETIVEHYNLTDATGDHRQMVLAAVRSLLRDGLVAVGAPPGRGENHFRPWPGSIDEVMARLTERYGGRYGDPDSWEYAIWIGLTEEGDRVAAQARARR
jgi:hypothetical protein